MAVRVLLQVLVVALVFTILTTYQVSGEKDCHDEKDLVFIKCKKTISIYGDYVPPNAACREAVIQSDMTCICLLLNLEDEDTVSVAKIIRVSRECNNPVAPGTQCSSNHFKFHDHYLRGHLETHGDFKIGRQATQPPNKLGSACV
ncbi:hypothetical protein ACP70R_006051 [Stipagrostis hirtigluma subsp. patula]